jgi:hypothetical protein
MKAFIFLGFALENGGTSCTAQRASQALGRTLNAMLIIISGILLKSRKKNNVCSDPPGQQPGLQFRLHPKMTKNPLSDVQGHATLK